MSSKAFFYDTSLKTDKVTQYQNGDRMGSWGYGIFDDDTAYDFVEEIKKDPTSFFKSSFEYAIQSTYLGFDECHRVTISAAYIDAYLNGTKYRTDSEEEGDESNVNMLVHVKKNLSLLDLKVNAVKALEKVLSNDSELNEIWSENESLYPRWRNNLEELIHRLQ